MTSGRHSLDYLRFACGGPLSNRGCGNDAATESDKSRRFPQRLWESQAKKQPDFPTFPQPLLLVIYEVVKPKPDISLAKKTGHFNLLRTSCNDSIRCLFTISQQAAFVWVI